MTFDTAFDRLIGQAARLKDVVDAALVRASADAASCFIPPVNSRPYECDVPSCIRPAYASGKCNAHYLRVRAGRELDVPVRARKRDDLCADCGAATGAKGGWGLCRRHYRRRRYEVIKDALIAAMGGRCARCAGEFDRAVFDFHHVGKKTDAPSALIANTSADDIARELAGCELLCANCHRIEHANEL